MTGRTLASLVLLAVAMSSCGDDDADANGVHAADVLSAAIRDVVAGHTVPADSEDHRPVVFVVGVGEDGIDAAVQAEVATELRDDIDVRFADAREEPIDSGLEDEPVRDDGVLLLVSDVPESGNPVEMSVEIYRSLSEWTRAIFTITVAAEHWSVTATSLVALDAP
jgi:hypothetical protein